MKNFLNISFLCFGTLVGCSSGPKANYRIEVDQKQAFYTREGEERRAFPESKVIEFDQRPILIESPGKVGVMVVPIQKDSSSDLKLNLKNVGPEEFNQAIKAQYNKSLNDILIRVNKFHQAITKKHLNEALTTIDGLIQDYQDLAYLKFLKASCLLIRGEKGPAQNILKQALTEDPNNIHGRQMYESFFGNQQDLRGDQ